MIIGIDPSLTNLGYVTIDNNGKLIDSDVYKPKTKGDPDGKKK